MASQFTALPSDLPKYKRHISFFENEYTKVCTGINIEATCSNRSCKSVRNFEGLVVVKFPGVKSFVYQEVVPYLRCPSCSNELRPERVKGVVFVRCEAKINIGMESVVFRVRGDETVLWELPNQGTDVLITLLDRDPEPKTDSKEFLYPGDGVNLSAVCRNNECQASVTNNGLVVIRVGRVESRTYQELLYNRSCPSCNHPLEPNCFHGIIFNSCQGEVEIAGNVQKFNAHQMPKLCKIDLSDSVAIIRMRQTITDIHSAPKSSEETVRYNQRKTSSPIKVDALNMLDQILEEVMGKQPHIPTTPGLNLLAKCSNFGCASNEKGIGSICIGIGSANCLQYKDVILGQTCPTCHQPVPLTSFKGILFFQCKAKIVICGEETEYVAGRIPEGCGLSLEGADVEITVLERRGGALSTGLEPPKILQSSKGSLGHSDSSEKTFTRACIGLNLEAMCINPTCEASVVVVPCPNITECEYSSILTGLVCPGCQCGIPPLCFIGITLVKCKAEVRIGNEKHIVTAEGDDTVDFKVNLAGPEVYVKILKKHIFSPGELSGGSGKEYLSSTTGLNGVVVCENPNCLAFKENDGQVIVNFQAVSSGLLREVANSMMCPACFQHIRLSNLKAVVFVRCSGQIQIGSENESFSSEGRTTSTFQISPEGPEVTFSISHKSDDRTGVLGKGGDMSYVSACHGINFEAHCPNERCAAFKENHGFVNIMSGHMMACDYRSAIQTLTCPSCSMSIPPTCFRGVALVRCRGEILIGQEKKLFQPKGDEIHKIPIPHDGTRVKIELYSKETYKSSHVELGASDKTYTKVCDGVNFIAFCKNTSCLAFKEYDGCVSVKRDQQFIERNGLPPTRCNYSREIQRLICPECGNPLNTNFVEGVALVRCKGTLESSGKSENFLAERNNILRHKFDRSDASAVIEYEVTETVSLHSSFIPGRGLNLLATCTNASCPSQSQAPLEGIVSLKMGEVTDCRLQRLIQGRTCPRCHYALPPASFISTTFTQCTARIKTTDFIISYIFGQRVESVPIGISKDPVVDIRPVQTKDISMEPYGSPYKRMNRGMNLKVICSNLQCASKKSSDGIAIISLQEMKLYKFKDLFSTVKCPSCHTMLSHMILLSLSFIHCRAEMLVGKERFVIEAGNGEAIDFKPDSSASDVTIHVMEKEADTSALFPDDQREGSTSKGGDFSHHSVCHGLNFLVRCSNPECGAVKSSEFVMIQAGHIIDRDLRPVMQSLSCSSCEARISPRQVLRITFLCCSGEITISGKKERFSPTGQATSDFKIPCDNSPLILKIYHREYNIVQNAALGFLKIPYNKHHNGVNFHCYCKNPSCTAVRERHGLVVVQRDDLLVRKHGYSPSTCYYSREISQLNCTSCGSHLKKYYVWGVGLLHCRGTITRDGAPVEHFSPSMGQVEEYQLDTGDTSLKIEFRLI